LADQIRLELFPLGRTLRVGRGSSLREALFPMGVEFPCGGRGRCKGCRVKVLDGNLLPGADDQRLLSESEIREGWRLACRATADEDLKIELAQWETAVLGDETSFVFEPGTGLGAAVDIGTTTIVVQLLDLETGHVLGVRTALNSQAKFGADIMSRIDYALSDDGEETLRSAIRAQVGELICELLSEAGKRSGELKDVVIVGNTAMHHLFCGVPIAPLASYPFEPENDGLHVFGAGQLGWPGENAASASLLTEDVRVGFLPCLGGFVGSDILAGVLATGLHQSESLAVLIDLGTNGEIVIGNRQRMVCASTAAGPAFEGARISMGMRAATGAISEVSLSGGKFICRVLGQVKARGICGSGLVDAVAAGLENGMIAASGRLAAGVPLELDGPVILNQKDIRELQLAKGAIAAGVRILLDELGAATEDISRVFLAGAFGNYISRASARRIGLFNFSMDQLEAAGNTALLGAKRVLFAGDKERDHLALRGLIRHISLKDSARFQEVFVEEMGFPG
jgi:uncharacterized 2Fe-2S/4Fe-4S cluster protein (DUF4445 family)